MGIEGVLRQIGEEHNFGGSRDIADIDWHRPEGIDVNRVLELVSDVTLRYQNDTFFKNFKVKLEHPSIQMRYKQLETAFATLDDDSWERLKQKACDHFHDGKPGRLKQGFFAELSDAFAYAFLINSGAVDVQVLAPVRDRKTPDLCYTFEGAVRYCEVKTIFPSDVELHARKGSRKLPILAHERLSQELFNQVSVVCAAAREQLQAMGSGFVYLVLVADDFWDENLETYKEQFIDYISSNAVRDLYVQLGVGGPGIPTRFTIANPQN